MRIISRDPRLIPEDGWLTKTPRVPAAACSWCGVAWSLSKGGALLCTLCDRPRPRGELQPVNLGATNE